MKVTCILFEQSNESQQNDKSHIFHLNTLLANNDIIFDK